MRSFKTELANKKTFFAVLALRGKRRRIKYFEKRLCKGFFHVIIAAGSLAIAILGVFAPSRTLCACGIEILRKNALVNKHFYLNYN